MLGKLKDIFKDDYRKVYLVGGTVRDLLMKETPKDVDLVAALSGEYLINKYNATPIFSKQSLPVFTIHDESLGKLDIALPRVERKVAEGHSGFEVFGDPSIPIEKDLERRDFTISSMAMTLDGDIIDPFNGKKDIKDKIIRHTNDIAFVEDSERVFRALRFSCKGFDIHHTTQQLIKGIKTDDQTPDRISLCMMKAMAEKYPHMFFINMVRYTPFNSYWFHEVYDMLKVPAGSLFYHPENDVFSHSIMTLKIVSKRTTDPVIRLAAFLHDIGKLATPVEEWPKHYGHDNFGSELVTAFSKRFKLSNDTIKILYSVAKHHMVCMDFHERRDSKWIEFGGHLNNFKSKEALIHIIFADSLGEDDMTKEFELCSRVAAMSATQLGIDTTTFVGKHPEAIRQVIMKEKVKVLSGERKLLRKSKKFLSPIV